MSHYSINHIAMENRQKEFQRSPKASPCPRAGKITRILTQNLFNLFLKSTIVMTGGLQLDGTLDDLSLEILLIST